jgi:hypothetical protein
MVPPQPSSTWLPQSFVGAGGQALRVHPQTFGVPPPPQVLGDVHAPQFTVPPQPSGTVPQLSPAGHVGIGVQPH